MNQRQAFGKSGEDLAVRYLKKKGYKVIQQNYTCPVGEIDIIASKDERLLFVEVKVRAPSPFGLDHLVPPSKQRKIGMVAREFMGRYDITKKVCQFDVALLERQHDQFFLSYIENAFACDE